MSDLPAPAPSPADVLPDCLRAALRFYFTSDSLDATAEVSISSRHLLPPLPGFGWGALIDTALADARRGSGVNDWRPATLEEVEAFLQDDAE